MADKLMVVAHPDDEIIFGGAHLLTGKRWKVICVTNSSDRRRAREFSYAMQLVGADYEIWNYEDSYSSKFNQRALMKDLQRVVRQNKFKKIVTHNLRGEYGHPQHKAIARIMHKIVKSNLYVFAIGNNKLPQDLLDQKKIMMGIYFSQRKTISELPLSVYVNRESFKRVK